MSRRHSPTDAGDDARGAFRSAGGGLDTDFCLYCHKSPGDDDFFERFTIYPCAFPARLKCHRS